MKNHSALPILLLLLTCGVSHAEGGSFEAEVASIFQRRCLSCHNDDEPKGDLSLSLPSTLAESGFVDSDDVDSSYLLELITPNDGKAEMPKDAEPLSSHEIEVVREWIASGAEWTEARRLEPPVVTDRDWWSLQPIVSPSTKENEQSRPPRGEEHPVDWFIDAKLAETGIRPVGQADPITLIRRLTLDLTGLPPSPAEVDAFVRAFRDDAEVAWSTAVDRLLHSTAFGEKWAQHWLDAARYAETHGYDKDKPRNNAWPYRDYVIRSFNSDKPYSRFVQEQVAGDILFPGDPDGILGLGFLAAGPWDFIGHWEVGESKLDGRIAKHLDRDEMVSAVFNVFMSTTVQCAQCHHHKFDPIRMEDYYRLHAVFAAVDRADRVYRGLPPEQQQRRDSVLANINRLKREQESLTTQINRKVAAKTSGIDRQIAKLKETYGTGLSPEPQYGYHSEISQVPDETKWVQLDLGKPRMAEEVRIIPAYDQFNNIGAGFGFPTRYRVQVSNDAEFQSNVRLLFDGTKNDQPNPKSGTVLVSGDGKTFRFLRVTATKLGERRNDYIFALGEIEVTSEGGAENFARGAQVTAKDSIELGVRWGRTNLVDSIYFRELSDPSALTELRELEAKRAAIDKAIRPPGIDERLDEIHQELDRLDQELDGFPAGSLVYAGATHFPRGGRFTATEGKPRPIHLLHRGDLRSPGDWMTPGAPPLWDEAPAEFAALRTEASGNRFLAEQPLASSSNPQEDSRPTFDWDEGEARAELARYLTRPDNPLVWRSIVNRLWLWTFGAPLVGTPNDFGRGGVKPTHPELLDYLAATLRDDPDGSLKSIIRLLVTSQAYRRSSEIDPHLSKLDSENAWLWRANRRRLTAEEFRDSLLASAGVLNREGGGKSFQDFVIEKPEHSPHYEYHLHDPADAKTHRRSIYRFVVRSQPQPLLTTLDCADPSISVPRRDESTTALQALAAWNSRLVEFAASELGKRMEDESNSPDHQVYFACRLVLSRPATPLEQAILREHLDRHGPRSLARVLFNMNAFLYVD